MRRMTHLHQWATRYNISPTALVELRTLLSPPVIPLPDVKPLSEAAVSNNVRLTASRNGGILWRNNVGVLPDANGRPVRFGLANDSTQVNAVSKSSDLIGITPVQVTQDMVGSVLGRFTARECKEGMWKYTGTAREVAQLAFINYVNAMGGDAAFSTGAL
jgi:hypothetical protein